MLTNRVLEMTKSYPEAAQSLSTHITSQVGDNLCVHRIVFLLHLQNAILLLSSQLWNYAFAGRTSSVCLSLTCGHFSGPRLWPQIGFHESQGGREVSEEEQVWNPGTPPALCGPIR